MLVIGRRAGQKIFIGPDIIVDISRIDKKQVHVAIDAPREIRIWREELLDNMSEEEREVAFEPREE